MIKFRRGSTKSWKGFNVKLESGQPGYDKTKHKIKVGDGETSWSDLPYASGLFAEEILDSEANAKKRLSDLKKAQILEDSDTTIITYGKDVPGKDTVGQIYLQQIDEPEVDYIVESGVTGIWTYQKWKSGIAKCWCNYSFTTTVQEHLELFCRSTTTGNNSYPIKFSYIPTETATLQSSGGQVLLANSSANTKEASGSYVIISLAGEIDSADYRISMQVEGFWRTVDGNNN